MSKNPSPYRKFVDIASLSVDQSSPYMSQHTCILILPELEKFFWRACAYQCFKSSQVKNLGSICICISMSSQEFRINMHMYMNNDLRIRDPDRYQCQCFKSSQVKNLGSICICISMSSQEFRINMHMYMNNDLRIRDPDRYQCQCFKSSQEFRINMHVYINVKSRISDQYACVYGCPPRGFAPGPPRLRRDRIFQMPRHHTRPDTHR